jgi:hypothetical protein
VPLVFFFFFLPEMKGRTLEELDELFQNKVPVRGFPKYECISSERAREIAMEMTEHKDVPVEDTKLDLSDSGQQETTHNEKVEEAHNEKVEEVHNEKVEEAHNEKAEKV